MAKKKTTVVTEEEVIEEAPKDQEIDYKKDIAGKKEAEIIAEGAPETPEDKKEDKVEEKPIEEETETVEFDPEQLKKEAKEEARQEMAELLAGKTDKEQQVVKDEYESFVESYKVEHPNDPDWKVYMAFTDKRAEERERAREEANNSKLEEEKKTQEEKQTAVNSYVDSQFDQLYATNRFPKIVNKNDENDLGLRYRKSLADQTMQINKARLDQGLPTKTLVEVFFTEFKAPNRQPAGGDAPVSAGSGGGTPDNQDEVDYVRDVKGKSFFNILMRRN